MNKGDYQSLGILGVILGALFLASGIFTYFYYEAYTMYGMEIYRVYPYATYSGFLLGIGILALIVGLLSLWLGTQAKSGTKQVPQTVLPPSL